MRERRQPFLFNDDFVNHLLVSLTFGEGNGKPLQYSCLENPMDE